MADAGEIGRMLGFGIDADRPPQFLGPPLGEVDDLGQRRHLILAVVGRITGAQLRQALLRAERLQFGEREILGKPVGQRLAVDRLGRLAAGEFGMLRDVGGATNRIFVARDQHIVLGRH